MGIVIQHITIESNLAEICSSDLTEDNKNSLPPDGMEKLAFLPVLKWLHQVPGTKFDYYILRLRCLPAQRFDVEYPYAGRQFSFTTL